MQSLGTQKIIVVIVVTQIHSMNNGVHDPSGKGNIYMHNSDCKRIK